LENKKIKFLLDVLKFSFTAFGGPQAHIAMMLKEFVEKKKYVTESELIQYNALSQMLPGPSSTQTLVAIAYKLGGIRLAISAFFIWILPSSIMMLIFSIAFVQMGVGKRTANVIYMLKPIAIGFVAYSAFALTKKVLSSRFSYFLAFVSLSITILFQNAYVFPAVIILGVAGSILFGKGEIVYDKNPVPFNWKKLIPFFGTLIFFALLGALINRTSFFSLPVRLFENFYRNGIMIFGGGQVLVPLMYTEFVEMKQYLTSQEFLAGFALQQAIPGPLFSFTSFIGSMSMREGGIIGQTLGSFAAVMGINIPGLLFMLMIFPAWEKLKVRKSVQRALDGINSVSVGFACAALYIMSIQLIDQWISIAIVIATFLLLLWDRIPSTYLILVGLLVGLFL
jgi:chromate transporter